MYPNLSAVEAWIIAAIAVAAAVDYLRYELLVCPYCRKQAKARQRRR